MKEHDMNVWKRYKKLFITGVILLLAVVILFIAKPNNSNNEYTTPNTASDIVLIGDENITLEYGDVYTEEGAVAYENATEADKVVSIYDRDVNFEKIGTYEIIYYFIDVNGNRIEKKRYITIVDSKAPEIKLIGNRTQTVYNGEAHNELGATAYDNYDKDITYKITVAGGVDTNVNGSYKLTYSVCDSSNNCASVGRTVNVVKKENANFVRLSLHGVNTIYLEWPDVYNEPGFSVDSSEGDITHRVEISGKVNTNALGTYTLTYKVTNSNGLEASDTRTVIVRDTTRPAIELNSSSDIEVSYDEIYADSGYTANDNYDGDLTSSLEVATNYIPDKIGTYYYKYIAADSSGNKTEVIKTIRVVDRIIPTFNLDSSKENVTVEQGDSWDPFEGLSATDGYDGDLTSHIKWTSSPEFDANVLGVYLVTLTVCDFSDNEALPVTKTVTVADTVPPTGGVNYSITSPTNGDVEVTLTVDEDIEALSDWTKVDNVTYKKVYTFNTSETLMISDLSGNTSSISIDISNIDKTAPVGAVAYSTDGPTNGVVTVTLSTDKDIRTIPGWSKVNDREYTKDFSDNTNTDVSIIDNVGNVGSVNVEITCIDKVSPTADLSYSPAIETSSSVVVTLSPSEELEELEDWTKNLDGTYTKSYDENTEQDVIIVDKAGNSSTVKVVIDWIRKDLPIGIITYDPDTRTKNSVTATLNTSKPIQTPDGWTLKTEGDFTVFTKVYDDNVSNSEVLFVDFDTLVGKAYVDIDFIDKVTPTATITYNPNGPTNRNVTATLIASEAIDTPSGWTMVNDNTYTRTYPVNVNNENVILTDLVGNVGSTTVNITGIDKTPPTISMNYSTTSPTNRDVIVTLTSNEAINAPEGWANNGDSRTFTKTYAGNVTNEKFNVADLVGNTREVIVNISWIDKVSPEGTVTYNPNAATNGNVVATLTSTKDINTPNGWAKLDDKTFTKSYSANVANEVVELKDSIGNSSTASVNIDFIDKTAPTGTISYSTTNPTNSDVKATLTTSEEVTIPSDWVKVSETIYTKTYTDNASNDIITLTDKVGNVGVTNVSITWIDKVKPDANVIYSPNTITNTDVRVTIDPTKDIIDIEGFAKEDDGTFTKTYSSNITTTITLIDKVGNTKDINISITWIDKVLPTGVVSYSPDSTTSDDVVATLSLSKQIRSLNGWEKVNDTTYTKVYQSNVAAEEVKFVDLAGNAGVVIVTIDWIDKVEPTGTITYNPSGLTNTDVIARLETNKEIVEPNGWHDTGNHKVFTKTYTSNSSETIELKDLSDNLGSVNVDIDFIDKTAPAANIIYTPSTLTNLPVEVVLSPSEDIDNISGWSKDDEGNYRRTYSNNIDTIITMSDFAGNSTELPIKIDWIDNVIPTGTITYNPDTLTNTDVIATLVTNKNIIAPNGWENSGDNKTFTKTYSSNSTNESVELLDVATNRGTTTVNINWIDKIAPTAEVMYSTTNPTNQDVGVTVVVGEEVAAPSGWANSGDNKTFTKVYSENGEEILTLTDAAGNVGIVNIKVENINKIVPVIASLTNPTWTDGESKWSNANVKITPVMSTNTEVEKYLWNKNGGEWLDTWTGLMTDEGEYTIGVKAVDYAGNISEAAYTTLKIDKTAPIFTMNGSDSVTVLRGQEYNDLGVTVYDLHDPDIEIVTTSDIDINVEGNYQVQYRATDKAGNSAAITRRVYVTSTTSMRYAEEMQRIEELILSIAGDESSDRIGTALEASTLVNIRGINYYQDWYLITKQDLYDAGYQDTTIDTANYLDMAHASYIVRYEVTPGAVQSILGEYLNGSYVHSFNFFGDFYTDGLLSAINDESTKTASMWGELTIAGGSGVYDSEGGLSLGTQYATLSVDQTKPINERLTVSFTVKGTLPQPAISEGFPGTIVAISAASGQYLSWIGVRNQFLHVYSYTSQSAKSGVDVDTTATGFASIDLTKIIKDYDDSGDPIYYDYHNDYMNITVTAQRAGETKVYINGKLIRTFDSDSAVLTYNTLTIGDLRADRGLRYQGNIYNYAFYSEVLDQTAINQNWNYFKRQLGIQE